MLVVQQFLESVHCQNENLIDCVKNVKLKPNAGRSLSRDVRSVVQIEKTTSVNVENLGRRSKERRGGQKSNGETDVEKGNIKERENIRTIDIIPEHFTLI